MATYSYRGLEYKFVDTQTELLEELKCPICLELVSDPVQTTCGHLFCGKCIEGIQQCPVDRESFTTTPDHFNNRRVRNFKVNCSNKEKGCKWQGDLGDADKHKNTSCNFAIVVCTNDGCDLEMERRRLDNHLSKSCSQRRHKCPYCSHQDTYQEVFTTHFTKCEEMPLPCPGGCGKRKLVRRNMAQHLSEECPEELVPCTYATAGCKETVKRKNLKKHLKDKDQHFDTLMASHLALSCRVRDVAAMVNSGNHQKVEATHSPLPLCPWLQNTPTCYPCPPWVIKMEGFQKMEMGEEWFSDPVYSHFGGYKMCLRVVAHGNMEAEGLNMSVYISLMRGDNDGNLKWPFKGTIKVSLLNQLEDRKHYTKELWSPDSDVSEDASKRVTGRDRALGIGQTRFISHQDLSYISDENVQFLNDDTLFLRVDCFEPKLD